MTWNEATFTWNEGTGSWNNSYVLANKAINTGSVTNKSLS